jgi:hypothetical protein
MIYGEPAELCNTGIRNIKGVMSLTSPQKFLG